MRGPSPQYRYEHYDPRWTEAPLQISCYRAVWACGCVTWLEWESGAWVPKLSRDRQCRLPHQEGQS